MNIQPDFEDFLRLLETHQVEYMIVGGYAVAFHGYPRFTKDIDIFFSSTRENVQHIIEALVQFGFPKEDLPAYYAEHPEEDPPKRIQATIKMLQQFGDTKVLSSPKIMALNNQTALLKVVNEEVYFTVELDIREATRDIPERRTFTSELHTVPIGLIMSVTPQISDRGYVSLNIRPTISRITGFAVDPAPRLAGAEFDNLIPEIQVREIESLLQILDRRTVVLGGLMQNERISEKDGVPGLARIPGVGKVFSYTRDKLVKTELVIFLKPTIVTNGTAPAGGLEIGDYYTIAEESKAIRQVDYR